MLWTLSLVVLFALPVGTFAQTFTGMGNPQPVPVTGTGGFPCTGGPTTSVANVAALGSGPIGAGQSFLIDNVTIDITHTWDSDLDIELISPSGTVLDLSSDNGGLGDNYTNTVFMDGAPSITTGAPPFTGVFQPEGGMFNTVFAGEAAGGNWTLSICDDTGGDSGTLNSFSITFMSLVDCDLECPADITAFTSPDVCGADVDVPLPTLDAASLAGGCVFLPGGEPMISSWILPDGTVVTTEPMPYPLGTTTVVYTATASGSGQSGVISCDLGVTVIDDDGPVLNCPLDQTINLQGGECTTIQEFTITAVDNCDMNVDDIVVLGLGGCNPATASNGAVNGIFCPAPLGDLSYLFPHAVPPGAMLDEFCFTPFVASSGIPIIMNIYCWDGNLAGIPNSSVGDVTGTLPFFSTVFTTDVNTNFDQQCVDISGANTPFIPGCENVVIEILAPEGMVLGGAYTTCAGLNNSVFLSGCGIANAVDYIGISLAIGGPDAAPAHSLQFDQPASVFGPLTSLDSGSELGIGINSFSYIASDAAGNTSTCAFDIVVNGVPEDDVVTSLACNDVVNISIDENCEFFVGADLFLEGGPYNCYDDCYEVYIFGPNNTPIPGVTFDAAGNPINYNTVTMSLECGNYVSMVRDICTSDVTCWGEFIIEDKIAPVVIAPEDITLTCLQSTEPSATVTGAATVSTNQPNSVWIGTTGVAPPNYVAGPNSIVGDWTLPVIPNAVITDIDVCLGLDNNDLDDFDIMMTGPNGQTIVLYTGNNGNGTFCPADDNIDATFDSESTMPVQCNAVFANGMIDDVVQTCPGEWMGLGGADARGIFTPQGQTDATDAGLTAFYGLPMDGSTYNWSFLHRFADNSGCIGKFDLVIEWAIIGTGIVDVTNSCGDETTEFIDETLDGVACGESIIRRTYISTDAKGNQGSDVQLITVEQVGLDAEGSGWFFPDSEVTLNCNACVTPECIFDIERARWVAENPALPSVLEDEELLAIYNCNADAAGNRAAYPFSINSKGLPERFDINNCNLFFSTSDLVLETCGAGCSGNYKIIRTWTALDWCTGNTAESIQTIDASDSEAPTIDLVSEITVSASIHDCEANFVLPNPEHLLDNCDNNVTFTVFGQPGTVTDMGASPVFDNGVWRVFGLPISASPAIYTYAAEDCCGNVAMATLTVNVVDATPPVAIATQNIVVNLTASPNDPDGGAAKLFVESVDNGSHDGGCGPVELLIRRTDDAACGNIGLDGHNNNESFDNRDRNAPFDLDDTDGGQFVKFCCEDLASPNAVTDANGNTSVIIEVELLVVDALGNQATTWVNVRVESKLQPVIICPADVVIECEVDEADLSVTGMATGSSACGAITPLFMDLCGIDLDGDMEIEAGSDEDVFNKACHYGPITRIWYLEGTSTKCVQNITINEPTNQFDGSTQIDWPYSRNEFINLASNDGATDCGGLSSRISSGDIEVFEDEDGNPSFAEVTIGCVDALCEEPVWVDATCSLIGWSLDSDTFFFEDDACRKIINTYTVIDWCQFNPASGSTEGIWTWTVVGKLIDPFPPTVTADNGMFPAVPGGSGSVNPTTGSCVGFATASAVATDTDVDEDGNLIENACPSQWLKWNVYVDIGADWIFEREYSSFVAEDMDNAADPLWSEDNAADNLRVFGYEIPDVRVGNRGGVDNAGGLDELGATPPGFEYMINIPDAIPADCGDTQHRVEWRVYDGCGNVSSTVSFFTVQDIKAPTPFCINLSTALMEDPDGAGPEPSQVALWAIDFDFGSFDNCTDPSELRFTFSDVPPGDDPDFDPIRRSSTRVFSCDDFTQGNSDILRNVDVYVWDACGNFDFCTARIRLRDNNPNGCTDNMGTGSIAGRVETEFGESVEDVSIQNQDMQLDYVLDDVTDSSGDYAFDLVDMNNDFEITAEKNDDYLNGVSTLDLVVIQRHILGSVRLDSPYKMIAADVNNDKAITAIDLIQLRKLILGVYDELPSNSSWRFADASVTIDATDPWNSIDESININNLSADMMDEDFIGIKIGDVNQSVVANAASTTTESRSAASVDVVFDDRSVEVGEIVELVIKGEAMNDLYGYQFTLGTDGLELVEVESGIIEVSNENFGIHGNKVTTSWNSLSPINTDGDLFTMTFKSNVAGQLSEILDLNSSVTRAEAYVGSNLDIVDIELRNNNGSVADYALFQNEPNPFTSNTIVGFELPEAGSATISVRDVAGKVISVINGDYAKGYNEVELSKSDIGTAGVYFYQLDSGDFTATKKMIIIE